MTGDDRLTEASSADSVTNHGHDAMSTRAADAIIQPRLIGAYVIEKVVGRGGMGVVYLAHDPRAKRDVALKVIPSGPDADPTDLARFKTEAEAVARLDHPNIVRLYEVGETDGVAFLAMEYVEGGTLYQHVKGGRPLDILVACRIVEQIARASHYAHQHGVVHRDLKPSNILLKNPLGAARSSDLENCIPKLADFGLAKQLDQSLRLTRTGTAVGTPHYMAPEQARGESAIGPALDIHGLGAILYELLTGSPPFMGGDPAETMEQVVYKTPTRPSLMRVGIPPALEAICLKCLEKEPRKRYRSAAALADELCRFIDNPNDSTIITSKATGQSGKVLTLVGIAILLVAATAVITWFTTSRAHRAHFVATQNDAAEQRRLARRARLEAAIALCEQGHVKLGLERMRELESDESLPVRDFIAAWRGRVFEVVKSIPDLKSSVFAMSPFGNRLASGDGDRVRLWSTADWSQIGDGWQVGEPVTAIGWSENGRQLAIGTSGGKVWIADTESKVLSSAPLVERKGKTIAAVGFAFPGVRIVYTGENLRQEYVPPLQADPNKSHPFDFNAGPVVAMGIAPMTGDAAAVLRNGSIRVYDATDSRWRDFPADGEVTAIAYSSDGNVLAIGTRSGAVRLWDALAGVPLTDTYIASGRIDAISVGFNSTSYVVVISPENSPAFALRCERPWIAPPIRLPNRVGNDVLGVALPEGAEKVFVTTAHGVSVWRVRDGKRYGPERRYSADERYRQPAGASSRFSAPAMPGPKNTILVGGTGGKMFLVDGEDGRTIKEADGATSSNEVTAVAVCPKGQTASAQADVKSGRTIVRHWNAGMDKESATQELPCRVHQEAFLADGSGVLLACDDGRVRIWDPTTNRLRTELNCGSPVLSVSASDDGKHVLAGCADGTAQLWDLETIAQIRILRHRSEVRGVAIHEDKLITASADGTARRWHAATGLPIGPPISHPDAISALSVWGDLASTGGRGRYVRIWRID